MFTGKKLEKVIKQANKYRDDFYEIEEKFNKKKNKPNSKRI